MMIKNLIVSRGIILFNFVEVFWELARVEHDDHAPGGSYYATSHGELLRLRQAKHKNGHKNKVYSFTVNAIEKSKVSLKCGKKRQVAQYKVGMMLVSVT